VDDDLLQSDFFDDLFDTANSELLPVDEINSTVNDGNILTYWQNKEDTWPKLSQCAKWILSVPATSTSSERVFSLVGRTIDDRQSQMKPDTIDGLLLLHGLCVVKQQLVCITDRKITC